MKSGIHVLRRIACDTPLAVANQPSLHKVSLANGAYSELGRNYAAPPRFAGGNGHRDGSWEQMDPVRSYS